MRIEDLETPALVVDLDKLEANIARVAAYSSRHKLRLRPHTKTHKTPEIGRMQLEAGAVGLTTAKTTEAEVMLDSGAEDLLVAYPVLGRAKTERLARVAKKARVTVALDSLEVAQGLNDEARSSGVEFGILVEANVGQNRSGVDPGAALIELAQAVDSLRHVRLEGFNFYSGHVWPPDPDGSAKWAAVSETVSRIRADFERAGLPCGIVSGGTTPTLFQSHEIEAMNEIRPGTSVFFDRMQALAGVCTIDQCAATILTTVVSAQDQTRVILDGGSKTFSSDPLRHAGDGAGWGLILDAPDARFYAMNEEHGRVDTTGTGGELRVGDRVRVLPNHICVAVNLHERIHAVRGDEVEAVWTVRGRGKLQ